MSRYEVPQPIVISGETIEQIFRMDNGMEVVESAFREHGEGRARMPAKIYLDLPEMNGDFRAMPAYLPGMGASGIKWVNSHPGNAARNLPTVMAIIILNDPETAVPLAIMDGTYITKIRTGAAGGVAAKYLARPDSRRLALVGCGAQAITQLEALKRLFQFDRIRLFDPNSSALEAMEGSFPEEKKKMERAADPQACVNGADIVVTTTPTRKPILERSWIAEGAHINAVGADAPGKQELDPEIIRTGTVIVDDVAQASHSGEVNVPIREGQFTVERIASTLGQVVCRRHPGRSSPTEITIFDSTGLAIQDLAAARFVYEECHKSGKGTPIRL